MHTLPGPSAAIAALTLAGLPTDRFLFLGFLPAKAKARAEAIAEAGIGPRHAGLVRKRPAARRESLPRFAKGWASAKRRWSREISKLHEETVTGTLAELAARYAEAPPKGEIVIVVGPPPEARGGQRRGARRGTARGDGHHESVARSRRCRGHGSASLGSAPTRARSSLGHQLNRQHAESAAARRRRSPPGGCACRAGGFSPAAPGFRAAKST